MDRQCLYDGSALIHTHQLWCHSFESPQGGHCEADTVGRSNPGVLQDKYGGIAALPLVARHDRNMKDFHAHARSAGEWGIAPIALGGHCEERGDEAISHRAEFDIASAAPRNDTACRIATVTLVARNDKGPCLLCEGARWPMTV